MATCRWSSHATDLQINLAPLTFTTLNSSPNDVATAQTFTAEPRGVDTNMNEDSEHLLDSTHPPHPSDHHPSVNPRPKTRFTLHRILSATVPTIFAMLKFIDVYRGIPLTLRLPDLILAVLQLILYICSWYELDPPPSLRFLHETDWDYFLKIGKQCILKVKQNLLKIWCTLAITISILPPLAQAIWLLRTGQTEGFSFWVKLSPESLLMGILSLNVLTMLYGADKHRKDIYRHIFIVLVGSSSQLGSLVTWALSKTSIGVWMWRATLISSFTGCSLLFIFTGYHVPITPFQSNVASGIQFCLLVSFASTYPLIMTEMLKYLPLQDSAFNDFIFHALFFASIPGCYAILILWCFIIAFILFIAFITITIIVKLYIICRRLLRRP